MVLCLNICTVRYSARLRLSGRLEKSTPLIISHLFFSPPSNVREQEHICTSTPTLTDIIRDAHVKRQGIHTSNQPLEFFFIRRPAYFYFLLVCSHYAEDRGRHHTTSSSLPPLLFTQTISKTRAQGVLGICYLFRCGGFP